MNPVSLALSVPEVATEPYEPRGIFPSEMALVIGLCRAFDIDVVIESGRARGLSTRLLAKYLPDADIVSVERFRDDDAKYCEGRIGTLPNVTLVYGDGVTLVPELVELYKGFRIAVLIDGPKGLKALALLESVKDKIAVGFIHDMRKLDHDAPALFRIEAETWPHSFFTDDEIYVEATRHMDALVPHDAWRPGVINGKATGSYGPTLGVFPCSP